MQRTIKQWRGCSPHAMTYNQSPAEAIPLAFLEYRPIYEGDLLYDKDGKRLRVALPLWTKEYPLRLEVLDKQPGDPDCWATDTHFEGKQVLFWSPPHLTNSTSST